MAEVTVSIGGRQYAIHCRDGEEVHLDTLAGLVDAKAYVARQSTPGLTEVRQLLFAALFLADEINDLKRELAGRQGSLALPENDDSAAVMIESLAGRLESLAERLAPAPAAP
ncbi:cell division protein ZapA [Sphingobium sp. BS19]|uniref:cell division protein ZapA n=1 Tax=Sphingobium sp. BS19 TaxID=3018973 RepID=UPI0022EE8FEB|nr:cell division protein ZapA [Sphingobium sp. BS19]GLI99187.1 cell division protein ZapA [Sphingobium sp. BS19]